MHLLSPHPNIVTSHLYNILCNVQRFILLILINKNEISYYGQFDFIINLLAEVFINLSFRDFTLRRTLLNNDVPFINLKKAISFDAHINKIYQKN